MRSRVMLMVALLATAGIMAAMAYTSAEVRNPADATIVRTDVALLALDCAEGTGYKDENCEVKEDGRLHLDFSKGRDGDDIEDPDWSPTDPTLGDPYESRGSWYVDAFRGSDTKRIFLTDKGGYYGTQVKNVRTKRVKVGGEDRECIEFDWQYKTSSRGNWQHGGHEEYCFDPQAAPTIPGGPGSYGFQPGSTYRYGDLVKVTNNSEDSIDVSVELPGEWNSSGMDLDITGEGGQDLTDPSNIHRLGPGEDTWINFAFNVPDNWSDATGNKFPTGDEDYPFGGTLTVHAVAVD